MSDSINFLPPIGMPPSIELIPPARLLIDGSYQRSIDGKASQNLIARIARQWDWRLCVPLLVSRRDNGLFVIDGQHRMMGALRRTDILYLPCCVGDYASAADEAAIFVESNARRRPVGKIDTWRAALLAGDATALAIDRALQGAGLQPSQKSGSTIGPGEFNALRALEAAIAKFGEDLPGRAVRIIGTAFARQVIANAATWLATIMDLQRISKIDDDVIAATLTTASAERWIDRARRNALWAQGGEGQRLALRETVSKLCGQAQTVERIRAVMPPSSGTITRGVTDKPAQPPVVAVPTNSTQTEPESFEEKLARIERGEVRVVPVFKPSQAAPDMTLGGVGSSAL